jgi:glutamyl-tRNA synthetase
MRLAPVERKVVGVIPILQRAGLIGAAVDDATRDKIRRVVLACGDRLKIFTDVIEYGAFFFREPRYDPKAIKQRLGKEGAKEALAAAKELLAGVEPFDVATLEARVKEFCETRNLKFGDLNHSLRVATTGVMIGPGVFECLAILGKTETLRRIDGALKLAIV